MKDKVWDFSDLPYIVTVERKAITKPALGSE
jgi:hypothetical protein